jgi:Zn-finger nucleic acid-binding protein
LSDEGPLAGDRARFRRRFDFSTFRLFDVPTFDVSIHPARYDAAMPRCPVCKTPTDLIRYEHVPVYNCGTCGGHWLTPSKLNVILRRQEVLMPPAVRQKMDDLARAANSARKLNCLSCGVTMQKRQMGWARGLALDQCPRCESIWLDQGELEKLQIAWEDLQARLVKKQGQPPGDADLRAIEQAALFDADCVARRDEIREQASRPRRGLDWLFGSLYS